MALPDDVLTSAIDFGVYLGGDGTAQWSDLAGRLTPVHPETFRPINLLHVASGNVVTSAGIFFEVEIGSTQSPPIARSGTGAFSPDDFLWSMQFAGWGDSPPNRVFALPAASDAVVDYDRFVPAESRPQVFVPVVTSVEAVTEAQDAADAAAASAATVQAAVATSAALAAAAQEAAESSAALVLAAQAAAQMAADAAAGAITPAQLTTALASINADLAAATNLATAGALARRSAQGTLDLVQVNLAAVAPVAINHATRKDYVDGQIDAVAKRGPTAYSTATTIAPVIADANRQVDLDNTGAITITLPTDAALNFPVGTQLRYFQYGVGQLRFVGPGTTLAVPVGFAASARAQYSVITATKRSADFWILAGDLTPTSFIGLGDSNATASTVVRRDSGGGTALAALTLTNAQSALAGAATRKDYVDTADTSFRRLARRFINTDLTIALADEGTHIDVDTALGARVVTIPNDTTLNLPVGYWVEVATQNTASVTTIIGETGTVLRRADTSIVATVKLRTEFSTARLLKVAANTWLITGDIDDAVTTAVAAATPNTTASTLVKRDGSGYFNVNVTPTLAGHPVSKTYADALGDTQSSASTTWGTGNVNWPPSPGTLIATLSGTPTIGVPTPPGSTLAFSRTLILKQAATGGPFAPVWTAALEWNNDASAPTMPTVANAELVVDLFWTGTAWRATLVGTFFP